MNLLERGKFYQLCQNNSGGSFDVDDRVCHRLFIEAPNVQVAIMIAESLGCYWNGCDNGIDCECCGDRWYAPDESDATTFPCDGYDDEIFNTPEEYCQMLADKYGETTPDCRIFYMDGKVVPIYKNNTAGAGT